MPRQNRVTPFGEIIAVPDRGMFMGNRGTYTTVRVKSSEIGKGISGSLVAPTTMVAAGSSCDRGITQSFSSWTRRPP